MRLDWASLLEILRQSHRVVLTSHIRPDCDALGSELGMAGILEALGKHVRIVNAQATPASLKWIDPDGKIESLAEQVKPADLADRDLLIVLDDCMYDRSFTRDPVMRGIFMNGRHWKVMLVLTMQYCMDLPVNLRTNIDYVFLMRETNPAVVERLYKNFGGSFSTLPAFAEALRLCTEDHGCMVIDNVRSAVFHYRAKDRGDFRVFHSKVWSYSKKRNVKSTSRPSVARASDGTIVRCHH